MLSRINVEFSLPSCALPYDITQSEELVCASSAFLETHLFLSQLLVYCIDQIHVAAGNHLCKDLAWDGKVEEASWLQALVLPRTILH